MDSKEKDYANIQKLMSQNRQQNKEWILSNQHVEYIEIECMHNTTFQL
jgi:hypothetical protein